MGLQEWGLGRQEEGLGRKQVTGVHWGGVLAGGPALLSISPGPWLLMQAVGSLFQPH